MPDAAAQSILDFWFGPPPWKARKSWFEKDAAFDAAIRENFGDLYARAKTGACDSMAADAPGTLALILLLDQFPRNMFRNDPRAFATDAAALAWAEHALDRGYDKAVDPVARTFIYLPFEHAEDLTLQERSLQLFSSADERAFGYAQQHHDIIARFGRFPHRNAVLGRDSTAEEIEFLKEPNSSF